MSQPEIENEASDLLSGGGVGDAAVLHVRGFGGCPQAQDSGFYRASLDPKTCVYTVAQQKQERVHPTFVTLTLFLYAAGFKPSPKAGEEL